MAPKRKRMKLEEATTEEFEDELVEDKVQPQKRKQNVNMTFLSLNPDCIYAIFGHISLNDLCAVSKTCTHLQSLASKHFMRCYKSKVMTITDVTKNGELVVSPKNEEYIRCFEKSIQNVTFDKSLAKKATLRAVNQAYRFKKTDAMTPIKILRIDGWGRGLRMSHRPALANLVKNVESVTISNTKVHGDLNECLLTHIPDMKRLTLWQKFDVDQGNETTNWMHQMYPKLEYFAWHTDTDLPIADVKRLFELNPNINFFSLHAKSRKTLRQLLDGGVYIDELYMDVDRNGISAIFDDLRSLCEQQFCKRLHLKFSDVVRPMLTRHLHQLIPLGPFIEGLYFENTGIEPNFAQTIITFDNLKVLQLNIAVNASILSKALSLEEIFAFWGVNSKNFKRYQEAMLTYAENTPTLKKIYMRNNSQRFDRFEFDELDLARKENVGASKLKIYFKTDEWDFTGKLDAICCDYDMVQILRVETEHVNNPLVTEYLTTKALSHSPYLDYVYGR